MKLSKMIIVIVAIAATCALLVVPTAGQDLRSGFNWTVQSSEILGIIACCVLAVLLLSILVVQQRSRRRK